MVPVFLSASVSSAAVDLLSPLWLAILLLQQLWPHMLSKKEGDVPNGMLLGQQFVQLLYGSC